MRQSGVSKRLADRGVSEIVEGEGIRDVSQQSAGTGKPASRATRRRCHQFLRLYHHRHIPPTYQSPNYSRDRSSSPLNVEREPTS